MRDIDSEVTSPPRSVSQIRQRLRRALLLSPQPCLTADRDEMSCGYSSNTRLPYYYSATGLELPRAGGFSGTDSGVRVNPCFAALTVESQRHPFLNAHKYDYARTYGVGYDYDTTHT
ncbi:hypothetical protein V499_01383 [Pseudogymnoascus sp. VKM F-103]|nr:hypothetical protein V499_01383 [Pseudogymnoascus sp. VKM F-103]